MNFGEIKSFLKGTSLFDMNQANNAQSPGANLKPNLDKMLGSNSSYASIVERSESSVLGFNVLNKVVSGKLAGLDPNAPPPPAEGKPAEGNSLFDFEEVAKNVLSFVEKALHKAQSNGADDERLATMLDKAREGIEMGFAQAREELEDMGQLTDEVETGIENSYDAIQNGLAQIQDNFFGDDDDKGGMMAGMIAGASQVNYSMERSSSLSITTNDGDKVTINFAEAMAYQRSEAGAIYGSADGEGNATMGAAYQMSESTYQAAGFSFSVEGDLDDDEKAAIAELVGDVSKLADEFFNGDIDKAFEQAMELGYDETELSGFALNMSRVETVSVAAAYQQVAQYEPVGGPRGEGQGKGPDHGQEMRQLMKPVANYLKDLMDFIEKSREQLESGGDMQSLMDQAVGRHLEFRGESNIPDAMARFAEFNQRLLGLFDTDEAAEPAAGQDAPEVSTNPENPTQGA